MRNVSSVAGEQKPKKSNKFDLDNFQAKLISELRRISYRWEPRKRVMRDARVARGDYECKICGPGQTYKRKEFDMDHVLPVVDPNDGFIDWNTFIERLFCGDDGFQILCKACHKIKTQNENTQRRKGFTKHTKQVKMRKGKKDDKKDNKKD